jgi:hypothetical protein
MSTKKSTFFEPKAGKQKQNSPISQFSFQTWLTFHAFEYLIWIFDRNGFVWFDVTNVVVVV